MTNGLSGPVFHSKVSVACPTSFPGFSATRSRRTGKRKPWEQCGDLFDMYNLDPRVLFRPTGAGRGGGGSTGVKFPSPPMWSGDERRRIEIASCALMKHCTPLKTTTQTIISKP